MIRQRVAVVAIGLAGFLVAPLDVGAQQHSAAASGSYTIADLGLLPGLGYFASEATAINSKGQVAGVSYSIYGNNPNADHAFRWDPDSQRMTDLAPLPGDIRSLAFGINDAGEVVGRSESDSAIHAVRWGASTHLPEELGSFGGDNSVAYGINATGQIVGQSALADGEAHAFLWDGTKPATSRMMDLKYLTDPPPTPGGGPNATGFSIAAAISDDGMVVGGTRQILSRGFVYSGAMQPLDSLTHTPCYYDKQQSCPTEGFARAIKGGKIVGWSDQLVGTTSQAYLPHATLWQGGSPTDLGALPGEDASWPSSINSSGAVVGASGATTAHPFLLNGAGMVDLNSLLPANSGWQLLVQQVSLIGTAGGGPVINDKGQIAGLGVHNGQTRAFLLSPNPATCAVATSPAPLVVTTTDDTHDCNPGDGVCADTNGTCSLLAATEEANKLGGGVITFDIAGGGSHVILQNPGELSVGAGVVVDGTTQPGYAGEPLITVESTGALANVAGFALSGATLRGLAVRGFGQEVTAGNGNVLEANWIGLDASGAAGSGSGIGEVVTGNHNRIGGSDPSQANVIAGNGGDGIMISGGGADDNAVLGNRIGLTPDGKEDLPNRGDGVHVIGAPATRIGGAASGDGNEIAGNGANGIEIQGLTADGAQVIGNQVGTNTAGELHLGNTGDGVLVDGVHGVVIGGSASGARNVIAGNHQNGVELRGANAIANLVEGNAIGVDETGAAGIGNDKAGVAITQGATGTVVGGARNVSVSSCAGPCNVISGNSGEGVLISGGGSSNEVLGNFIGTDEHGTTGIANVAGIVIDGAPGNFVGGHGLGEGNLISGNLTDGIRITGAAAVGNVIEGNLIGPAADGTGELSASNSFGVVIDGAGGTEVGTAGNGNLISGNRADGLEVSGPGTAGTLIKGNDIGTYIGGGGPLANGGNGVTVGDAPGVSIGGTARGDGNTISGNARNGIAAAGAGTTELQILANRIGVYAGAPPPGTYEGNGLRGVQINEVTGVIIGLPGAGNVISGNGGKSTGTGQAFESTGGEGVFIAKSEGPHVQANLIGTNAAGTAGEANRGDGIRLDQVTNAVIGGSEAGQGNVLSGNGVTSVTTYAGNGIGAGFGVNLHVYGNRIGTNEAGTAALPNSGFGLFTYGQKGAAIGLINVSGHCASGCNLISANGQGGIAILRDSFSGSGGNDHFIRGNFIGTDANGKPDLGNMGRGIFLAGPSNSVGGPSGMANVIAANEGQGVVVAEGKGYGGDTRFNVIGDNAIFKNTGLGIDLGGTGTVLPNDPSNPETGANDHQHFPVLVVATTDADGMVTLEGKLNSVADSFYVTNVYANDQCDPSGFGQGQQHVAQLAGRTDASGEWSFSQNIGAVGMPYLTATATDSHGNTSEFSRCLKIDGGSVSAQPAAPQAGQGVTVSGNGLAPNSSADLTLHSAVVSLGTLNADSHGAFRAVITIPTNVEAGPHTLQLTGVAPDHSAPILFFDLWILPGQAAGPPSTIAVSHGSPQSTTVGSVFGTPLTAIVKNAQGLPVPNVAVVFNAPTSGPSASFAGGGTTITILSNASGLAGATTLTANQVAGDYTVIASVNGVSGEASFSLTNLPTQLAPTGKPQPPGTAVVWLLCTVFIALAMMGLARFRTSASAAPPVSLDRSAPGTCRSEGMQRRYRELRFRARRR